ncbi:SDR family NAD(P)-dependent oxidoreductase [Ignavigranum ruoffiae]|uniref:SDR family NAD(P)-dependent oxidoreductase n=1 Tax=Ignavigranum ruoffiae TaxID=89093 RepID=UPI0024AD37CA|nr:SDR family NAD(P)-dependent oxidoreductase [Ignavigranum ruoffiae]
MENLFDMGGQFAVITGASSGLGRDMAVAFAKVGVNVALLARRKEKLEALAEELKALDVQALPISCDVSNDDSVKQAIEEVRQQFPRIDILINNAGVAVRGTVDTITDEDWDRSFDVNVKGILHTGRYVVPVMKEQGYGRIVNISSVNAIISDKNDPFLRHSYNASKASVWGLTRAMAASYAKEGIAVNAIGPGLFASEMTQDTLMASQDFMNYYNHVTPASRSGEKGELNGAVLFLSSPAAAYIQGNMIFVDGGIRLV